MMISSLRTELSGSSAPFMRWKVCRVLDSADTIGPGSARTEEG